MQRTSPLDAGFLDLEDEDRHASLAIASIAVFEGPTPSHDQFLAAIAGRLPLVPRYRHKARQLPLDLGRPVWVDDPHFEPSTLRLTAAALRDLAVSPVEQLRALRGALDAPRQALRRTAATARGLAALAGALVPTSASSLSGPIGRQRRYRWARASLADVKAIRSQLGGTMNDVALAAITGAFRALLLARGEPAGRDLPVRPDRYDPAVRRGDLHVLRPGDLRHHRRPRQHGRHRRARPRHRRQPGRAVRGGAAEGHGAKESGGCGCRQWVSSAAGPRFASRRHRRGAGPLVMGRRPLAPGRAVPPGGVARSGGDRGRSGACGAGTPR